MPHDDELDMPLRVGRRMCEQLLKEGVTPLNCLGILGGMLTTLLQCMPNQEARRGLIKDARDLCDQLDRATDQLEAILRTAPQPQSRH